MRASVRKPLLIVGIGAWFLATGLGFLALARFENKPGEDVSAPATWPSLSRIQRSSIRPTMLVVFHPQCSCSHATVGELALLVAHTQGRADIHALFFKPASFDRDWVENELWRDVSAIPGVDGSIDEDGATARLFHATTSGAVVLYDREGRLMFEGGITPSRSHSGDNAGRSAIVALLNGGVAARARTFVFGCSILGFQEAGEGPQ